MIVINNAITKIIELWILPAFNSLWKTIDESQYGFRPLNSVHDAIYRAKISLSKFEELKKSMIIMKLDLNKVYDRVNRYKLLKILNRFLRKNIWNIYKELLTGTKIRVTNKELITNILTWVSHRGAYYPQLLLQFI